jgi:hypothetical protein
MNQNNINGYQSLISNNQTSEILKPGSSSLHDPPSSVSVQFPSILIGCFTIILSCRNYGINSSRRFLTNRYMHRNTRDFIKVMRNFVRDKEAVEQFNPGDAKKRHT